MARRRNYPLVVFGNPGTRGVRRDGSMVLSHHVHAILYRRLKDDADYVHGFGDADVQITEHRDGSITLGKLHLWTDVEMIGQADGTILIRGRRGQPLWETEDDD